MRDTSKNNTLDEDTKGLLRCYYNSIYISWLVDDDADDRYVDYQIDKRKQSVIEMYKANYGAISDKKAKQIRAYMVSIIPASMQKT